MVLRCVCVCVCVEMLSLRPCDVVGVCSVVTDCQQYCALDWRTFAVNTARQYTCVDDAVVCAASYKLRLFSVVLAADVVYDDALTDAFVSTLVACLADDGALHWVFAADACLTVPLGVAVVTVDRRVVFCATTLRVRAPAYERFLEHIVRERESVRVTL